MRSLLAILLAAFLPCGVHAMCADTVVRDTLTPVISKAGIVGVSIVKVARPAQLDDPSITSKQVRWYGLWRIVDSNSHVFYTVTPAQGYSASNDIASVPRSWDRIDDCVITDLTMPYVFELFLEDSQHKVAPIMLGVIGQFRMIDYLSADGPPTSIRLQDPTGSLVIDCTLDWD